jgi:hypothetical protein
MSKVIPFTGEFVPGAQAIQEAEVTGWRRDPFA